MIGTTHAPDPTQPARRSPARTRRPIAMARAALVISISSLAACAGSRSSLPDAAASHAAVPPSAPREDTAELRHGEALADPYQWMRARDDPRTLPYLEAENAYTQARMAHTEDLQAALYQEMLDYLEEDDTSVPYPMGRYRYFTRTETGRDYPVHVRVPLHAEAPEETILDVNALAEGVDYLELGVFEPSPSGARLAFSTDTTGSERYTLRIKDLRTGRILPEAIEDTEYSAAWASDSTLYYVVQDSIARPFQLWRHAVGHDPTEDVLALEEDDDRFYLEIRRSRSGRFLFCVLESDITREVRAFDLQQTDARFVPILPRKQGVEVRVAHRGERLFVLENDGVPNGRLSELPVEAIRRPGGARPVDLVERLPHDSEIYRTGLDAFAEHLVLWERREGLPGIRVIDLESGESHTVTFDEPGYTLAPERNEVFETTSLRFAVESFLMPPSVFAYDMVTRTRELLREQPVPGYDRDRYVADRIFARAPDGASVPIVLVRRRDRPLDGTSPMFLEGYGAYGDTYDPYFRSRRLALLDRGVVLAIAQVRGGAELGREWYEEGKLLAKRNTFTDYIAVAEHLIAAGYTSPDRLAVWGESAGGLLVGAVLNMRPELFGAAVARVPFVDLLNTMWDESLPLTAAELEEWGDPKDPDAYAYMRTYSPYDNVRAQAYPDLLVTAGLNDPRVGYWEAAKWVARLRATKTDANDLLLWTNLGSGHFGASGRYGFLGEMASLYAFLLSHLEGTPARVH